MDLGLFQHIDHNRRRSVFLIFAAVVFAGVVGGVIGAASFQSAWGGVAIALVIAVVMALVAWNQGSAIVLGVAGAQEMTKAKDPELVNVVEEMAIASGLPRPKIYIIPDSSMNAFATGIAPDRSAVAVTSGLRAQLSRDELQGVIAHEMAHIGNFDTRIMILMAVMVGTVALMSDFFLRGFRFKTGRNKGNGWIMILAIVLAILAPIASLMIQFAVSRKREYLADATGAAMTRNPGALADALEKLGRGTGHLQAANRGTQHLVIVNPFRSAQSLNSAFATHPPLRDRISRLRRLAGRYAPKSTSKA